MLKLKIELPSLTGTTLTPCLYAPIRASGLTVTFVVRGVNMSSAFNGTVPLILQPTMSGKATPAVWLIGTNTSTSSVCI